MTPSSAAELKTLLVGVPLPAQRSRLLRYASHQSPEPAQLDALRRLPRREFVSLDEVVDELLRVQPDRGREDAKEPHEESGAVPGADDYTQARPGDTGSVRS